MVWTRFPGNLNWAHRMPNLAIKAERKSSSQDMLKILLVDDYGKSSSHVAELLSGSDLPEFMLYHVSICFAATSFINDSYSACIIDSKAANASTLIAAAKQLGAVFPIIVLTSDSADEVLEAIRSGAADCLKRNSLTAPLLERTICSAIEQAKIEKSRIENEQRYFSLVENADSIIYTHDLNGQFTSINRTGELLTGYSSDEVLQMNILQAVPWEYHDFVKQMITRKLDEQKETAYRLELLTKSGKRVAVNVSTHLVFENGRAIGVQGIAREISSDQQFDFEKNSLWLVPAAKVTH